MRRKKTGKEVVCFWLCFDVILCYMLSKDPNTVHMWSWNIGDGTGSWKQSGSIESWITYVEKKDQSLKSFEGTSSEEWKMISHIHWSKEWIINDILTINRTSILFPWCALFLLGVMLCQQKLLLCFISFMVSYSDMTCCIVHHFLKDQYLHPYPPCLAWYQPRWTSLLSAKNW